MNNHHSRLAIVGVGNCLVARAIAASIFCGELGRAGAVLIEPHHLPPCPDRPVIDEATIRDVFILHARPEPAIDFNAMAEELARRERQIHKEFAAARRISNQPFYMSLPKYQRRARRERHR